MIRPARATGLFIFVLAAAFCAWAQEEASAPLRLTLSEAIELGLENNPQLAATESGIDKARAQVTQAMSARLPAITGSANWVRSNRLPDFKISDPKPFATGPGVSNPDDPGSITSPVHFHMLAFPGFEISNTRTGDIYTLKVEAQYALYAGGRIRNGIKASKLNLDVAKEQVRQQEHELIFNIQQAFYGVLLAKEQVEVVEEVYETIAARLSQVRDLYNEGLVSDLDVLQVEAALASVRPQIIQARNGLMLARLGLNNLLNIDLETPVTVVGELACQPGDVPEKEELYAKAMRYRPEMRIMDTRIEMAQALYRINRAGSLPTVGLFANYSWDMGQELPPNEDKWRDGYQAGAAVSVPLFDGLDTLGKMREAEATVAQAKAGKRTLELGIRTQVREAMLRLEAAQKTIEAEEDNVAAARRGYEVAQARYSVGLATNLDVMDAQTQLSQAKIKLLAAIYDYNLARAQLEAALGMPGRTEEYGVEK